MNARTSVVNELWVVNTEGSTVIEIGDSQAITPVMNVLAVQRERAHFYEYEFPYEDYPMFYEPIPMPTLEFLPAIEIIHDSPMIQVDLVKVRYLTFSSVIHIGSTVDVHSESRVKNIRHLLRERPKIV